VPESLRIKSQVLPAAASFSQNLSSGARSSSAMAIVNQDGNPVTYRAGEVFAVPAGKSHTEETGPSGARIVVGRKY
jgi:hypothetical protein